MANLTPTIEQKLPLNRNKLSSSFYTKDEVDTLIGASTVEGTSVLSTGEVGGTKFLREDGDGTCSWQTPAGGHTQNTDTNLGALSTKNPPIDADKAIYRDSTASDALVTSTWTQIKAFLKTYFDTIYQAVGSYLTSANIDDTAYDATSWNGVTTNAPSKNAVRDKIEALTAEIPSVVHSTDNPYSWGVSNTQYISIVVIGVLIIDSSSAGAVDCSVQLQHGGVGTLATITVGLRGSLDTDRIPFALTYVAVGSGWEGNDFSVVEVTYGSTIEEVNWNFNYRL